MNPVALVDDSTVHLASRIDQTRPSGRPCESSGSQGTYTVQLEKAALWHSYGHDCLPSRSDSPVLSDIDTNTDMIGRTRSAITADSKLLDLTG